MILKFNVLFIKIPARIFEDTDKIFYNLHGKVKAKQFGKKSKRITLPDTTGYYTAAGITKSWFWKTNRHVDQQNRRDNLEIDPHNHVNLIFEKSSSVEKGQPSCRWRRWVTGHRAVRDRLSESRCGLCAS